MAQGKTENPPAPSLFMKQQVVSLRPWQLRTIIAPFGIIDMSTDRVKVNPGEVVTISFKAVNTADFTTIYPITLKINYEVVAAEVVSLPQKSVMPMKFTIAKTIPGKYHVDVNNSVEVFTVTGNPLENEIAKIEGFRADVSTIEANLDINSRGSDAQPNRREISVISARSAPVKQKKGGESKQKQYNPNKVQSGINQIADYIEKGLDKTGDIITYPIVKLAQIPSAIQKIFKRK